VRSRFQLQIDQVILCLKSSVNQQRLIADKKLAGTSSGIYFKRFKSFMPINIGKKAPDYDHYVIVTAFTFAAR